MIIHFTRVGFNNINFTRECKGELNYEWLYKQIKPYCKSRNIEFSYDEETNIGLIFGGLHTIGGFKILK